MAIHLAISRAPIILLFVIGVLVIAGSLAYIYLPTATITINPAATTQNIEQPIILSGTATSPDFIKFILPAKLVEKDITVSKDFQRAGTATDDFAHGTIMLVNNGNDEQRLVPKTHLRHEASGLMFLTQSQSVIPPQGKISMNVVAEEKGASGNVAPGKFIVDRLPASAQTIVFGQSDIPLSGGLSVATPLSDQEIAQAKKSVFDNAKAQALGQLTVEAGGAAIRPELLTATTSSEQVSAQAGTNVASFSVSTTIHASGFIVDNNDLLSLTLLTLRSSTDPNVDFLAFNPASFKVSVTRADFAHQLAEVKGSLTGTFVNKISPSILDTHDLAGLSAAEATDTFQKLPGVGHVQVSLSPFWVKTIPSRSSAVTVEIKNPDTTKQ